MHFIKYMYSLYKCLCIDTGIYVCIYMYTHTYVYMCLYVKLIKNMWLTAGGSGLPLSQRMRWNWGTDIPSGSVPGPPSGCTERMPEMEKPLNLGPKPRRTCPEPAGGSQEAAGPAPGSWRRRGRPVTSERRGRSGARGRDAAAPRQLRYGQALGSGRSGTGGLWDPGGPVRPGWGLRGPGAPVRVGCGVRELRYRRAQRLRARAEGPRGPWQPRSGLGAAVPGWKASLGAIPSSRGRWGGSRALRGVSVQEGGGCAWQVSLWQAGSVW